MRPIANPIHAERVNVSRRDTIPREIINHRKDFFCLETGEKAVPMAKKRRTMMYVAAAEGTSMVPEYLVPYLTMLCPDRVNSTPVMFCNTMMRLCVSKPT